MEHYLVDTVPGYLNQIAGSLSADWKCWGISKQDAYEETKMVQSYLEERLDFLHHYFLGDEDYCVIQVDANTGVYMVYQLVEQGATLSNLVLPVDNSTGAFRGWYYTESGLTVDFEQPVYEDLSITAQWDTPLWLRMIGSVLPLGICMVVMAIFFLGLLWADKRRRKTNS